MSAPLYERLRAYADKNRISFAMPGHKNGRGLQNNLMSLDVTELSLTENLHCGGEYVKGSQELLSSLYGSDESFILTNGSTAAIQTMICSALNPGGTLLAGSDCHMSVINTCALLGINIRFFPKDTDDIFNIPKGTKSIKKYLTPDIRAVIITSPNYYGLCSDIKKIAAECHEKDIPLLVDGAHGAHFVSCDKFPETAVHFADAVCHSAHKTLNAANGAAYLHLNGSYINKTRAKKALGMFQSSSPSYVTAATADTAREEIENGKAWEKCCLMCENLRKNAENMGIRVLLNDDITRVVLNFSDFEITGFDVSNALSCSGIDIEMADLFNIVLIITPSNTEGDIASLLTALKKIIKGAKKRNTKLNISPPPICRETLSPKEVFFSPQKEVPLDKSAGHISASTVVPYPPGIPVIFMGETIRSEQIEYIEYIQKCGGEITGLINHKISVQEK